MERWSHHTLRTMFGFVGLLALFQLGGCATSAVPPPCVPGDGPYAVTCYSSADVVGRIVDAESGEPVEGAVVVGIWQLESQGFEHSYGAAIHVVESVSDAEGNYRLNGFEGIDISRLGRGKLRNIDPYVAVFADGYKPGAAGRDRILERASGYHRVSPINGRDIKLKRGALDNLLIAGVWESSIQRVVDAGDCAVPRLSALSALLEVVEPLCDELLMKRYGLHCKHFHHAVKRCTAGKRP